MSRKKENTSFRCANCGKPVIALSNGSYRNHCPFCLYSIHIDEDIGDRQSNCQGLMAPAGIEFNSKKGYQIIHVCRNCGVTRLNRIAENTEMPDDFDMVLELMQ